MGSFHVDVVLLMMILFLVTTTSTAQDFKCTTGSQCTALVGYVAPNTTSIDKIQSLFNVKHLRSILGANNLPLKTPRKHIIKAKEIVKIPIPCRCTNNTGVSYNTPVYTIVKDDTLYHIAQDVFAGLVKYPRIQQFNDIPNANLIIEGHNLTIPLPCSCDDLNGEKVVHYAHIVESGSSFDSIAQKFGTDKDTLMELNDIHDESKLIADTAIDVPLKACNSSIIHSESLDSGLLVANSTYVFTANNCVKCKCEAADNMELQCEPSNLKLPNQQTCPSMACESSDSLFIGSITSNGCKQTTCAYAGYSGKTIFTKPDTISTCPTPSETPTSGNASTRICSNWKYFLFVSAHLVLFYLHLFK